MGSSFHWPTGLLSRKAGTLMEKWTVQSDQATRQFDLKDELGSHGWSGDDEGTPGKTESAAL
jgi:hypothetical protein